MIHHRFINDGRSPIPMGGSAEYACVCGKRGTHAAVERHIAVENDREAVPIESQRPDTDSDNFGGGDTKANYFPHEPRRPAPTGEPPLLPLLQRPDRPETPAPLPPPPATVVNTCPRCGIGQPTCDLPEISAWSCGHWIEKRPRSIAELFQDMLRSAFQAGAAATMAGESFETWYQREVLR